MEEAARSLEAETNERTLREIERVRLLTSIADVRKPGLERRPSEILVEGIGDLGLVLDQQPLERVHDLIEAMQQRFPDTDIHFIDTVCQPTKDRQQSLRDLAAETDIVIVVGGPDSNNSRKLVELARKLGRPAHLVASAAELRPEWFADCSLVGLTAGTSTPDTVINEVRAWLEEH